MRTPAVEGYGGMTEAADSYLLRGPALVKDVVEVIGAVVAQASSRHDPVFLRAPGALLLAAGERPHAHGHTTRRTGIYFGHVLRSYNDTEMDVEPMSNTQARKGTACGCISILCSN